MVDRVGHVYIVGAGIAGLAAAALMIRDGAVAGPQIHVLEASSQPGGSLDGAGDPGAGYVIRGGRMFEAHFACTYDLFSTIPVEPGSALSVSDDIQRFTAEVVPSSRCRLVTGQRRIEAPALGLRLRDQWDLTRLALRPEGSLDDGRIDGYFSAAFFDSNFWMMWCSMFAFQPWHSLLEFRRYLRRFMHLLPGFNRLEGIQRTRFNQFDALVAPLMHWLTEKGVHLHTGTAVADVSFDQPKPTRVTGLDLAGTAGARHVDVDENDLVLITLGSMTEDSSLGSASSPPAPAVPDRLGAWALWRAIARRGRAFGNPEAFAGDVARSRWTSFTVTLTDPAFFDCMRRFTGNAPGTGGLVTLTDSPWRLSVVLAHQPHFRNQPKEVQVFWGYGLFPDRSGRHVQKPMSACGGREILDELSGYLPLDTAAQAALAAANCIPCAMPYITSQFMPRRPGDRPEVLPAGAHNFAFLGQFCELPEDTVFTVEYSVRTARVAVAGLLGLDRPVPPVYHGHRDPRVLLRAVRALNRRPAAGCAP